jgi:transcriptional regulator with GAF, ATPase, and Fis domain
LAASGEIPARILGIRPPRYVTGQHPLVSEIDLSAAEFPTVRAPLLGAPESEALPPDVPLVVEQLGIVADHPAMLKALEMGAVLAASNLPILILGETGTGKELMARFIHRLSGRPMERFVPLNCAAIPRELVESVLFGHKKGAFTGAISDQTGKFAAADRGTLFLDELSELPLSSQAKLLRVLQDGLVEPLGARAAQKVEVRVIAATNRDLRQAVLSGEFREDLYYRLNVGEISLPPLRERRSDIPKIALQVLDRVNAALRRPKRLSAEALGRLQQHTWPGNVRDLQNVLERSVRLCPKEVLGAEDLLISEPLAVRDPLAALPDPQEGFSLEGYLNTVRRQLVLKALELAHGKQSAAARLLGLSPQAVHQYVQKLGRNFKQD